MLKQIIEAARLKPESCASMLRVPASQFKQWVEGSRPIPRYVIPELTAILGVSASELSHKGVEKPAGSVETTPTIWFKLRSDRLTDADRDFVGLVRQLGYFMTQLATIRGTRMSEEWRSLSRAIVAAVDRSAPPAIQGRKAALTLRAAMGFEHGQTGIGELLRPRLRQQGLVVIESPIPRSALEGCCFAIGKDNETLPCVFANTFSSSWYRRNEIIFHEVCHAIFDIENELVALDFRQDLDEADRVAESRARAFALHCMIPEGVLVHFTNQQGVKWGDLQPAALARLVAATHVEQRAVLRSAQEAGLISEDQALRYQVFDCNDELRRISTHALSTTDYVESLGATTEPKWLSKNRTTSKGPRPLRLPAGYVEQVISALCDHSISQGKAAEMLMIDEATLIDRFEDLLPTAELL